VKKNRNSRKPKKKKRSAEGARPLLESTLSLHGELASLKKDIKKRSDESRVIQERIQDIEIHVNLLTRLLTTLCVEKFGMRVGVLKRLIKRIEKEAIRDSQILHLESLYNLSPGNSRKSEDAAPPAKDDPWEDIS